MSTCRCEMKEGVDLRAGYGGVAEDASCQVECGRMPNAMAACAALKAFCPIQAMLTPAVVTKHVNRRRHDGESDEGLCVIDSS